MPDDAVAAIGVFMYPLTLGECRDYRRDAMSDLLRLRSSRRLLVVLGLAMIGSTAAPGVASAAHLDTASATASASVSPAQVGFPVQYTDINISAQSGTSGQNPSGNASLTLVSPAIPGSLLLSGPVTCMTVLGPDQGAGTSAAPTTALVTFQNTTTITFPFIEVELVDNGSSGDVIDSRPVPTGTDCSQSFTSLPGTFTSGGATVFDAPVLPTSLEQCKNAGWRSFGVFKNQGDCVSFVATGGKNPPRGP